MFVPIDTSGASEYYNQVRNLGLMYRFAFFYTDQKRTLLEPFTTAREIENYLDSQNILPVFIEYAKEKGLDPDYKDIRISKEILLKTIKAYIARNIIDNEGFYPIIADIDQTLLVAIDTISAL